MQNLLLLYICLSNMNSHEFFHKKMLPDYSLRFDLWYRIL